MTSATSWPERVRASARRTSFYWTDDGNLAGLRYDRSKLVFMEQRAEGLAVWENPLISLRFPKLCDLRADRSKRRRRMPASTASGASSGRSHSSPRRPTWPST